MEDFELIRRMVLVDGLSQREVALKLNKSRKSIRKALINSEPANYVLKVPKVCPVTDPVVAIVKTWLQEDKSRPRKQPHTKVRVFERLRDEYQLIGSRRAISDLVSKLQDKPAEVFCPIDHPLGEEVQIDWGEAKRVLVLVIRFQMYPIWLVEWAGKLPGGECLARSRVKADAPACQTGASWWGTSPLNG